MKFTNGYWLKREGWNVLHPREVQEIEYFGEGVRVFANTQHVAFKGAELGSSQMTATVEPVSDGVIRVRLEHFRGYLPKKPQFDLEFKQNAENHRAEILNPFSAVVSSGNLRAEIYGENKYELHFYCENREITSSIWRSEGIAVSPEGKKYIHEQLVIQPGESIFGLGERFGPVVKNGQTVDIWNADGGTASAQAYKNIPFYLSDRGYGIFVNHSEKVSYEVGSEVNTRVQFSVEGNVLEYFVIAGPSPKEVLRRYTTLTGRAPRVPEWSYGLWLSTSFKTDYSEKTVNNILDEMEARELNLSVLHFDCYWMRPSHWCDFVWDPKMFPNPEEMLRRYHERGIRICVWINPYIAQRSHLFDEGMKNGYLLHARDGSVRQWDHWQSGMAWVDFTNPDAKAWYQNHLRDLLRQGVDCFKTDFGERIPQDVVWFDGSDPDKMHNYYTYLYNHAVYQVLAEERGEHEAILFARSATAGSQKLPVHWGGDSEPTFVSMGETLRGGLSLGLSGFGYWSHDMGGFEGKPDPKVFIRWFPFGMFSSHSRLHGSDSFRTPWMYGKEAVRTAQRYIALKNRLMPYIFDIEDQAVNEGLPFVRHLLLEHPNDRSAAHVDTQYYFGNKIMVAPVFTDTGEVEFYLPTAGWTSLLSGKRYEQGGWYKETHSIDSLPILVPDGTVLPLGNCTSSPVYEWDNGVCLYLFGKPFKTQRIKVRSCGKNREFEILVRGDEVSITSSQEKSFSVCIVGMGKDVRFADDYSNLDPFDDLAQGIRVEAKNGSVSFVYL